MSLLVEKAVGSSGWILRNIVQQAHELNKMSCLRFFEDCKSFRLQGRVFFRMFAAVLFFSALIDVMQPPVNPAVPVGSGAPDGLKSFMERHGKKPYDLFRRGDQLMTLRVMFRDEQFDTPMWMLDNSPTADHAGTASVWSPWNVNASSIFVEGSRPLDDVEREGWVFNYDYSRMRPVGSKRPAAWAPEDSEIYYTPINPGRYDETRRITRNNKRTLEQELLLELEPKDWPGQAGPRIYGITRDRRHIFVDLPNRGIYVPFSCDEEHPVPSLPLYDGRPILPDGKQVSDYNRSGVIYGHEKFGDLIALRTGILVDRRSGERTNIAAPLCGNTNYLRVFKDGRVHYPRGDDWLAYGLPRFSERVRLPKDLSLEELQELWFNLPHATHGHEGRSPDGKFIATDGRPTNIYRVSDGKKVHSVDLGRNYHLDWTRNQLFFVGWSRGWRFGNFKTPHPDKANNVYQVFVDGTYQPVFNTRHGFNTTYHGGDFSIQSPDATKIHTASDMTGRFRNYIAVMARPRPPRHLNWKEKDGSVELSWKPSEFSHETLGYLVYRSESSGAGYELLTPEPVRNTAWIDKGVESGEDYYYVVTSLEHSGLESGYSEEAARAGADVPLNIGSPLTVYAEAENALRDSRSCDATGLAMGRDISGASDWYYLYRHPEESRGQGILRVSLSAADRYHVWARIRKSKTRGPRGAVKWKLALEGATLSVSTDNIWWTWEYAGRVELKKGEIEILFTTENARAEIDIICLTSDEGDHYESFYKGFKPEGPRPEKSRPPSSPADLVAENILERVNRLSWEDPDDPLFSHYNVYAARKPFERPRSEYLIGSPTEPVLIDWGLRAGTRYYYAVTSEDRRYNESEPVFAEAVTPGRTVPFDMLQLEFSEAELEGSFELSRAGGLRATAYVVPQKPERNRVSWQIKIPHEDKYYFWLRYLQRGDGARGGNTRQAVRVMLNGKRIITLDGRTDIHAADELIDPKNPLAELLWTWAWPGDSNLQGVRLPEGRHVLTLERMNPRIRYDVLLITNEPAFYPRDGRICSR